MSQIGDGVRPSPGAAINLGTETLDCFKPLADWALLCPGTDNHVHLIFKVFNLSMSQLLDAWKGFTAKQVNKVLGRRGKFWQDGYWDTFMRDEEHERRSQKYIEENPVKAGLVVSRKEWPWGSARFRDDYGRLCLPS